MTASATPSIPPGFRPLKKMARNPFIERNGPMYGRIEKGRFTMGFRVEEEHCNPAGHCHGGMLMTLADMLLIIGSNVEKRLDQYLVTVNLSCDFIAGAPRGVWLNGTVQVLRVTRNLVFSQGLFVIANEAAEGAEADPAAAGEQTIVLRASAILKPAGARVPNADKRGDFEGGSTP